MNRLYQILAEIGHVDYVEKVQDEPVIQWHLLDDDVSGTMYDERLVCETVEGHIDEIRFTDEVDRLRFAE
jgi:hypothetical protein